MNSLGGSDLISDDPMLIVVAIVVMQVLAFVVVSWLLLLVLLLLLLMLLQLLLLPLLLLLWLQPKNANKQHPEPCRALASATAGERRWTAWSGRPSERSREVERPLYVSWLCSGTGGALGYIRRPGICGAL